MKTPRTRSQAINAMCKQCIFDPIGGPGTWRQQVEACPSTQCPLWRFRPVSCRKTGQSSTTSAGVLVEGASG